jgi:hypothetical protein
MEGLAVRLGLKEKANGPLDFYDVGLHSVIVGDGDSDVAHVPFIVRMVTLDEH